MRALSLAAAWLSLGSRSSGLMMVLKGSMLEVQLTGPNPSSCPSSSVAIGPDCDPHYERLQVVSVAKPAVLPGTALVQVVASSVNPCDWKSFLFSQSLKVPGTDFAGVVETVGSGCSFSAGDEVWGIMNIGSGAYSEYIVKDCGHLGAKPKRASFEQAGSLGIVALTGSQAFRWAGAPWSAEAAPRVLVLGGSSGTGHVGIQLAKAFGAKEVITTCSPDNFGYVKGLGADRALDYHTEDWWEVLPRGSVDVIYDCISLKGTGDQAYQVLADGGRYITLLEEAQVSMEVAKQRPSVSQYYFIVDQTETEDLDRVTDLVDAGKLNITIERAYQGLDSVAAAFADAAKGHTVGKIALDISTPR